MLFALDSSIPVMPRSVAFVPLSKLTPRNYRHHLSTRHDLQHPSPITFNPSHQQWQTDPCGTCRIYLSCPKKSRDYKSRWEELDLLGISTNPSLPNCLLVCFEKGPIKLEVLKQVLGTTQHECAEHAVVLKCPHRRIKVMLHFSMPFVCPLRLRKLVRTMSPNMDVSSIDLPKLIKCP